jgi:hypothetical protein
MKIGEECFYEDLFACEHKGLILQQKKKREAFKDNQHSGCHQDDSLSCMIHSADCLSFWPQTLIFVEMKSIECQDIPVSIPVICDDCVLCSL